MIDHNDDFGFALKSPFQIAVLDVAMSSYENIGALGSMIVSEID